MADSASAAPSSRQHSAEVELCTIRSNTSHEQLFPTFYRRNGGVGGGSGGGGMGGGMGGSGGGGLRSPTATITTAASASSSSKPGIARTNMERVVYAPMAEQQKLGYFSTAALIVSKCIGTGVFAKPSVVLANAGGKGVALGLWFACGLMSLAGLIVYVEMGLALPFSGGEVIYVDEAYPRPKYLVVIVISLLFVMLTHWAGNCITFAKLILQAFDPGNANPSYHLQKFIALVMLTAVCAVHMFSRKMGIALNNFLAIYKVSLVLFIIIVGFAATGRTQGAAEGFRNLGLQQLVETEKKSMQEYASAILGVLWAYTGWENANYILSEVRRGPPGHEGRVFKAAAFVSIGGLTLLYILANIAYFTVLSNEELLLEGDIVAAKFFVKVFGKSVFSERVLKVMVALSILGNFISSTYSVARVKQEIAKLRILPFSQFWARQSHYDTPSGGLLLHWLVCATFIVFTPNNQNDEVYNLVTDLFVYGQTWMIIAVSLGIIALYYQPLRNWRPQLFPFAVLVGIIAVYVPAQLFVVILSWWPAPDEVEKRKEIPSYVTPGVATGIIAFGLVYWMMFAKVLPALGYEVSSCPDELVDGSRIVTYKRYKTGFAKRCEEWWDTRVLRRRKEVLLS